MTNAEKLQTIERLIREVGATTTKEEFRLFNNAIWEVLTPITKANNAEKVEARRELRKSLVVGQTITLKDKENYDNPVWNEEFIIKKIAVKKVTCVLPKSSRYYKSNYHTYTIYISNIKTA